MLMPIRITRAKNIGFAIKVAAALKKSNISLRLLVTGPPDPHVPDIQAHYAELQRLRRDLALTDEVIFVYEGTTHFPSPMLLEPETVAELYRISDLVLMPSHREGFGLPVLEAGLADKPIFATAMPVLEGADRNGLEYLIGSEELPESVAARIQHWADTDVAHGLRRKVRLEYTWSSIFSRQIDPFLQSLLGSRTGMVQ